MAEEKLDTTNKIVIPGDGNLSSEETKKNIIEGLKDLTPEDMGIIAKELDEGKERREREEKEKREMEEKGKTELESYRKAWREKIRDISEQSKEKIIEAAENIEVNVKTDEDGSRLIELKVGGNNWKILDPILNNHTDDEYRWTGSHNSINGITGNEVGVGGMWGDNVDEWKNKKLAEYVKQKQREGLHIAKLGEMRDLLDELLDESDLNDISDLIAMLMYLTGMDGCYRLSMGDDESAYSQAESRSMLGCYYDDRYFECSSSGSASLCMIAR